MNLNIDRFCVLLFLLMTVIPMSSQEEYQGLWYKPIDETTAEIIRNENSLLTGDLVIPDNINGLTVVSIGYNAFWGSDITSVILPETITNIDFGAFEDCDYLMNVTIGNPTPPRIQPHSFGLFTTKLGKLLVPSGSRNDYLQTGVGGTGPWAGFWSIYDNGGVREYYHLTVHSSKETGETSYSSYEVNGDSRKETDQFSGDYEEGTQLTISVTPVKDYEFSGMKVNDEDVTSEVTDNTYVLASISADTNIEVIVKKKAVALTISQDTGGSVSVIADDDIKHYQMRVVPDEGYELSQLSENGKNLLNALDLRRDFDRFIEKKGSYTIRYKDSK